MERGRAKGMPEDKSTYKIEAVGSNCDVNAEFGTPGNGIRAIGYAIGDCKNEKWVVKYEDDETFSLTSRACADNGTRFVLGLLETEFGPVITYEWHNGDKRQLWRCFPLPGRPTCCIGNEYHSTLLQFKGKNEQLSVARSKYKPEMIWKLTKTSTEDGPWLEALTYPHKETFEKLKKELEDLEIKRKELENLQGEHDEEETLAKAKIAEIDKKIAEKKKQIAELQLAERDKFVSENEKSEGELDEKEKTLMERDRALIELERIFHEINLQEQV